MRGLELAMHSCTVAATWFCCLSSYFFFVVGSKQLILSVEYLFSFSMFNTTTGARRKGSLISN